MRIITKLPFKPIFKLGDIIVSSGNEKEVVGYFHGGYICKVNGDSENNEDVDESYIEEYGLYGMLKSGEYISDEFSGSNAKIIKQLKDY